MTPSKVRKLLSLWARRASREIRNVSSVVISALRKRPCFRDTCARGATRVIAPSPSMGNTPKQTPNLLQLRRIGPSIRSLIYRRVGWHFAFSVSWSSFAPGPVQSRRFSIARPIVPPCAVHREGRWVGNLTRDSIRRRTQCIVSVFIFLHLQYLA